MHKLQIFCNFQHTYLSSYSDLIHRKCYFIAIKREKWKYIDIFNLKQNRSTQHESGKAVILKTIHFSKAFKV